jgi:hypothetical protein
MTAGPISPPSFRRGPARAGRASQHRRRQVATRGSELAGVGALWESLVGVLRSIDNPSSALLCTADGTPVAAYGLPMTELPKVSQETGTAFAARPLPPIEEGHAPREVETVELNAGQRHTVIASVPGAADADHLLAVSAEGVSPPLLHAWTRRAAEDLREVLADHA